MTDQQRWTQMLASKGTPGSPMAADGRHHVREFPCPTPPTGGQHPKNYVPSGHYLSADARMWCPLQPPIDQIKAREVLDKAFQYAWGRNPSSGV